MQPQRQQGTEEISPALFQDRLPCPFAYEWDFFTQVDVVGLADNLFNRPPAEAPAPSSKTLKETVSTNRPSWSETYGSLYLYNALTVQNGAHDTNTASRFIPAYDVWDLTVEAKLSTRTT